MQLTRFIGRVQEMARVRELLDGARLLTLTGAGGCGKTRLALQIAAELREASGEAIWLVELAPLSDPALVPQALAAAVGVPAEPGPPWTGTLVPYLKPRRVLLLLDNCEHLLSACAQLAETLLSECPHVKILTTSREALGLLGEQTYRVPSLSLPDPKLLSSLEELQAFEAVRLFADRATLGQLTFAVTEANSASVLQICQRLEGIPLAIELAAARLTVLPVEQIAARLDDRFRLLTGGSRTALPRQQTLRAVIDWSYDLLSQAERRLLCRLSVFAGGFTLEAAEAVGADPVASSQSPVVSGEGAPSSLTTDYCLLPSDDVLDLLSRLVEKSLVGYEAQRGEARYRLLETVRQYGRDRLRESGEEGVARGQHTAFFLRQMGVSSYYLGRIVCQQGDYRSARTLWEECLAIDREKETRGGAVLGSLAHLAALKGDYEAARALWEQSLAEAREIGGRVNIIRALRGMADVVGRQRDHAGARSLYVRALEAALELENLRPTILCLEELAAVGSSSPRRGPKGAR